MDLITYALCKGNGGGSGDQNIVVITKGSDTKASLSRSEIASLASNGVYTVYYDGTDFYSFYAINSVAATYYKINAVDAGGTITRKIVKRNIFDNKTISAESLDFYALPSSGIPETDLAQAVKDKLNPFIVTLTPTAQDFSGTMDKTVAEMTEAYNAGRQIVWRVIMGLNQYVDVNVTAVMTDTDYDYPSFNAYVIEIGSGILVYAYTSPIDDGTVQTYFTNLYSLTPLS